MLSQSGTFLAVPKRVVRPRKDGHVRAAEDDEMLLLDQIPKPLARSSSQAARTQTQASQRITTSPQTKKRPAKKADNDSETESEEEPDDILLDQDEMSAPSIKPISKAGPKVPLDGDVLMTPPQEVDPGREPGRIIGLTNPLQDFEQNMGPGDIVSKAVEDLGWAIGEIIQKPFARRRTQEMVMSLKRMREVAVHVRTSGDIVIIPLIHVLLTQEDEVETYNA